MTVADRERRQYRLEVFKAATTFFSSVIIAVAGILITVLYGSKEVKIAERQADAQIAIARNKELATLAPSLGSANADTRKFGAISLALYGGDAVPLLIALLGDDEQPVRNAAVSSLAIIGHNTIGDLTKTYLDRRNHANLRAGALYALGTMRAPNAHDLAVAALENRQEDPVVRKDAAQVMGFLKAEHATAKLLSVLHTSQAKDPALTSAIVFALGEIRQVPLTEEFVRMLEHPHEDVRYETVWALGKIGGEQVLSLLNRAAASDGSERVRQAATEAVAWMQLTN
jgi:HEAT repeat protein